MFVIIQLLVLFCRICCLYIWNLYRNIVSPSHVFPMYYSLLVEQMVKYIRLAFTHVISNFRQKNLKFLISNLHKLPSIVYWHQMEGAFYRIYLFYLLVFKLGLSYLLLINAYSFSKNGFYFKYFLSVLKSKL